MDKTVSSIDKFRQQFYDYLKKEDNDYVKARSKKVPVDPYRRKGSPDDPWLQCFYFNETELKKLPRISSTCLGTSENLRNSQIDNKISKCSSVSAVEINCCKAALRREARSRNLPDLSSKPNELRLLYIKYREELPKNFQEQRRLHGEMVCNMMNFEEYLKDGLELLSPLNKIIIATDTTLDIVTSNITEMRRMIQDYQTIFNAVTENLSRVTEKLERYQELDEKMDRDVFKFLAHFFSNFLDPRITSKMSTTKL